MNDIDGPACVKSSAAALLLPLLLASLAACVNMSDSPRHAPDTLLSAEQIATLLASPDRSAADKSNDSRRKPDQLLAFIGVRPGMTALDLSAGGGYTTELLARAAGPNGRVYGQSAPRNPGPPPAAPEGVSGSPAPTDQSTTAPPRRPSSPEALAERAKNPVVSNIVPVVRRFEDPIPPEISGATLDLVTIMFNYHDLGYMGVDRTQMNKVVFAALKSGGIYVIADHAGRPGTGISEAGTLHRVEEAFLLHEVESAGFKLVAEGHFLRNPGDPRDRNTPLPPQPKDDFVLKFAKP